MFPTTNTKAMYLTSNFYIRSVTYVKTTPVAKTIVKFYEIADFLLNKPFFIKKNYPFLQKTSDHLLIENSNLSYQHLQKTQFLEIIETPEQREAEVSLCQFEKCSYCDKLYFVSLISILIQVNEGVKEQRERGKDLPP